MNNIIPNAHKKVPLMFQAQTGGRCQLQRIDPDRKKENIKQDSQLWVEQWTEKTYRDTPAFGSDVRTKTYQINWRFVTNSGQDEGIIRPVIGAKGWPFYPGSSMKGTFRNACRQLHPDKVALYCGDEDNPGILRFHGGYPTDDTWQKYLLDIVHPQQDWQVQCSNTKNKPQGAFALISLFEPELEFGISCSQTISESEWETIWQIWQEAIALGIGCRVSSGYGQTNLESTIGKDIYTISLQGQGLASKLIDDTPEFRPNIFRAAIRGHALRIFGGLTNERQATVLVENLFGGVSDNGRVGLLTSNWQNIREPDIDYSEHGFDEPIYKVKGKLHWLLTRSLPEPEQKALTKLIKALTRFAVLIGGFGKSWRRVDHERFYSQYYSGNKKKPIIGCHWEIDKDSWSKFDLATYQFKNQQQKILVKSIADFIDKKLIAAAEEWMNLQGVTPNSNNYARSWREAWHPDKVQVWSRVAKDQDDSRAVRWFHKAYRQGDSIRKTSVTGGKIGEISVMWHRMYPLNGLKQDGTFQKTKQFLEIITIFPDRSPECAKFINFLASRDSGFTRKW